MRSANELATPFSGAFAEAGVGFAVKTNLISKLKNLIGIKDRLITLQIPFRRQCNATVISKYASTITNKEEINVKFYKELGNVIEGVTEADKL